jgi:DNA repair protein RecO (recombination protein O)
MSHLSTEALVLSTLRLGEADKLITFFTLTRGKIAGVAKGARRFKNRFGAALEPFTQCHLVAFEKTQNKLVRINQVDILHSFQKLRDNWDTIELGTQMTRLVLRITPEEQPHPALYNLLKEALGFLETGLDRSLSFILFMVKLIEECGFKPQWTHCSGAGHGGRTAPDGRDAAYSRGKTMTNGITGTSAADITRPFNISLSTEASQPTATNGSCPTAVAGATFSHREGGILCDRCTTTDASSVGISSGALQFLQAVSKTDFRSGHSQSPALLIKREVETLLKDYITYIIGSKKRGRW